jgi:hypothetical protein
MNPLRPELTELPRHMRTLPVDRRGYPIPWFVDWVDGVPEFRAMDGRKWRFAIRTGACWVCGGPLGRHRTFVIGPMCAVNRVTSEPPSHHDCAEWSARNCPFLARPHMVRREDEEFTTERLVAEAPGVAIPRNPGVALLWCTHGGAYSTMFAGGATPLIKLNEDPERVLWFAEGRPATRAQVEASIDSGMVLLREAAKVDGPLALEALEQYHARALPLYPEA